MEFNPWDPEIRHDPHTFWNTVRDTSEIPSATGPVTGNTFWFLTRYEDVDAALRSPVLGKEPEKHLSPELVPDFGEQGPFEVLGRNMLFVDPPDHTRLRALVRSGFSTRAIDGLAESIEAIALELLEGLEHRDEFDLIADFALPLPVTVIAAMLGIPVEDQDRFRGWTAAVLGRTGSREDALTGGMEFIAYLNDIADTRRADPQDDMISLLLHAEDQGDRLSHQEFLAMVFLLLIAGHETTVNLIGNGALELVRHPDEARKLRSDLELVESAVEEMLRFHGPVESTTLRWAFEDVEIGGHRFEPGDLVVPILMSANRDPAQFGNPDTFDLARGSTRHIAFGSGIHRCLGAPLARKEGQIAFRLLSRLGGLELTVAERELRWTEGFFLRGADSLPVRLVA